MLKRLRQIGISCALKKLKHSLFTDVLITDYSSILYDYLLMQEKETVLFLFDYEEYVRDRDFYYPFEENVVGRKVSSFE